MSLALMTLPTCPTSRPWLRSLLRGQGLRARARRLVRLAVAGGVVAAVAVAGVGLGSGCEGEQRARDASAPPSLQTSEVSVRFDVAPLKAPMISVLAFHATVSGVMQRDVLGIVDPLAAAAPERDCELRDLDLSASTLVAQGGSIELQELGGIGLALGASDPAATPALAGTIGSTLGSVLATGTPATLTPATGRIIRPFPRLFPDVATVVGGVVAEAGPLPLAGLPERIGLLTAASELPLEELAVPAAPRITSVNGAPLIAGTKVDGHDGLTIGVAGDPGTIIELRPFGATVAISCAVPQGSSGESTLIVPRALVARLTGAASPSATATLPASLDALSRARVRVAPFAVTNHLSIVVRASTAVELRP
jgi:hypothetical protein